MDFARMMGDYFLYDLKDVSCAYDCQWASETSPLKCPWLMMALFSPQGHLDPDAPLKNGAAAGHEGCRHVSRWAPLPSKWVL